MKINDSISLNQDLYINASRTLANPSSYGTEEKNSAYSININPQLSTRAVNTYENEIKNTNQAMAANQTATNAMEKQSELLDNIKDKLQKASETTNEEDRQNLLKDIQTKLEDLNNVAKNTTFNNSNLLQNSSTDSSASVATQYQVGLGKGQVVEIPSLQSNTQGLNLTTLVNQDPTNFGIEDAQSFLTNVNDAIKKVDDNITDFKKTQEKLEDTRKDLLSKRETTINTTNLFADYSKDSTSFSKQNIFSLAGSIGLSQANLNQDMVSKLLK
ncbi:flagellin [Aliarcobacter butzleri]